MLLVKIMRQETYARVLLNDDCNANGDGSASEVKITSGSATSGNAMNTANPVLSPKDSFQSAVLSAVCVEQQKHNFPAKNCVVFSGLQLITMMMSKRLPNSRAKRNLICSRDAPITQ